MLTRSDFLARFGSPAIIGMVHLHPLPDAAHWRGEMGAVIDAAMIDAKAIREGGATAMLFENFGDVPFEKTVGAATVAAMTAAVTSVAREVSLPFGINVLRNDPLSALAIAAATGASFIRVNVHTGVMATDQGVIEGRAGETLRHRSRLGGASIAIFADHLVKHAAPVGEVDPDQAARDLRHRGLADAILVTGAATGAEADPVRLRQLREILPEVPLIVASGVTASSAANWRDLADGVIVGTSIKRGGDVHAPVDVERVRALVRAWKSR